MSVFIPITCDFLTVTHNGTYHAVDRWGIYRKGAAKKRGMVLPPVRKRVVTACGRHVPTRLVACDVVNTEGGPVTGLMAYDWPPFARDDEAERCRECFAVAKPKRPGRIWRKARPAPSLERTPNQ